RLKAHATPDSQPISTAPEQMRAVADSLPTLIAFMDEDERYRFLNGAGARWHGLERPEQIYGRTAREVLGAAVHARVEPYFRRALAGETASFEIALPFADGTRHLVSAYVPQRDAAGRTTGFFVHSLDLTEQREIEGGQKLLLALGDRLRRLRDPRK